MHKCSLLSDCLNKLGSIHYLMMVHYLTLNNDDLVLCILVEKTLMINYIVKMQPTDDRSI